MAAVPLPMGPKGPYSDSRGIPLLSADSVAGGVRRPPSAGAAGAHGPFPTVDVGGLQAKVSPPPPLADMEKRGLRDQLEAQAHEIQRLQGETEAGGSWREGGGRWWLGGALVRESTCDATYSWQPWALLRPCGLGGGPLATEISLKTAAQGCMHARMTERVALALSSRSVDRLARVDPFVVAVRVLLSCSRSSNHLLLLAPCRRRRRRRCCCRHADPLPHLGGAAAGALPALQPRRRAACQASLVSHSGYGGAAPRCASLGGQLMFCIDGCWEAAERVKQLAVRRQRRLRQAGRCILGGVEAGAEADAECSSLYLLSTAPPPPLCYSACPPACLQHRQPAGRRDRGRAAAGGERNDGGGLRHRGPWLPHHLLQALPGGCPS